MILVVCLSALSMYVLASSWQSLLGASLRMRRQLSLVTVGLACLLLLINATHPAQPLTIDMDLIVPMVLDSGSPAMATVVIGQPGQSETLLIPLVARVPLGATGLWIGVVLCSVLFVLPAIKGLEEKRFFGPLHWIPTSLLLVVFLMWFFQPAVAAAQFEAYLTEFDLENISAIHYPADGFSSHRDWPLSIVVLVLSGLGGWLSFFIKQGGAPPVQMEQLTIVNRVSLAATAVLAAVVLFLPTVVTRSQSYLFSAVLLFAMLSLLEKKLPARVWTALGCFVSASLTWMSV